MSAPTPDERLLESVRAGAALLLSQVGRPPSMLRMQAGEVVVELRWDPPSPGAPAGEARHAEPGDEAGADELAYIRSPTVGVFYRAPEPGAAPFVQEGDIVKPGQQVGIVEAMKLMIPVAADRHGRVVVVLQPDAGQVEYDDRLISLELVG